MSEKQAAAATTTSFDAGVVLRPRTLDETLDLALAYIRASLGPFARLFGLLTVVAGGLLVAVSIALGLDMYSQWALALLLSPFLERVVTVYSGRHIFRNDPRIGQSIVAVLKRLPLTVIISILITLPWTPMLFTKFEEPGWIGVGAVLGSFWPFLVASHVHLSEVVLLEQLPVSRAAKRTRVLILYRFARALGLVIMSAIIRVLFAGGVELTTQFVLGFMLQFSDVNSAIGGWPALFGYLLAGQYIALARMFDYVDARTRREGWDIQVRFNAIAQKARDAEARRLAA